MDESDPFTALEDNDLDGMLSFLSDSSAAHNIALQVDAHDTSRMGPFVTLNEDVLRIILSLLAPPDACNMARTCRIAHSLATPYILSEVELRDWWPRRKAKRHAESFCHFILSTPERAHFLRKLDLRSLYICAESYEGEETTGLVRGSSMATALAAVIRQADNLEEVLIHCIEGDQALTAEPFLIHAIASRPCLRHLGLHTDGRDGGGLKLISQVCGPLRSLSLTIMHGHPDSPDLSVLARIAGTLEILELNLPYIATDDLYDLGPDFSLPAVQQVILRGWTDVQEMRRILPDLRVMHLQGCRFRLDVNPVVPGGLFKANEIDELVTDVLVPKVLGGLVRRLHLQYDPFRRGTSVEMLAHMNPVVLSCALFMPGNYPLSNIDYIAQRLPRLRYLELSVGWGRMGPVSLSAQLVSKPAYSGHSFLITRRLTG